MARTYGRVSILAFFLSLGLVTTCVWTRDIRWLLTGAVVMIVAITFGVMSHETRAGRDG